MNWSIFKSKKSKTKSQQEVRFSHAMDAAEKIIKLNQRQLPAMLRLLMRPVAAQFARHAFLYAEHQNQVSLELDTFFFSTSCALSWDGRSLSDLPGFQNDATNRSKQYWLDLAKDIVIPQPWNRQRLIESVVKVGCLGLTGKFSASLNHKVNFLLPFGLAWAEGGNHSIAAGISDGFGSLVTTETYDISVAYPHVTYDGLSFIRKYDGAILSKPRFEEAGILFEIGRRMVEVGVAYDAPLAIERDYLDQIYRK